MICLSSSGVRKRDWYLKPTHQELLGCFWQRAEEKEERQVHVKNLFAFLKDEALKLSLGARVLKAF